MRSGAGIVSVVVFLIASIPLSSSPSLASSRPPDPESTYTVHARLRLLKPVNADALNDSVQIGRILKQTDTYAEVEFTLFPLLEREEIVGNPNWKKDDALLVEYLKPGITCNYDPAMQQELLQELKADGIDVETLDDKAVVEKVGTWLLHRSQYNGKMFDTWFVDFPHGSPRVLPELKSAFESAKGDASWTEQEQFDHELLGRGMFKNRTSGSCTSYAILQATVFKALGIPTRIVLLTPIVDQNDSTQLDLIRNNIHHHRIRAEMLRGLPLTGGDTFSNHTINEVYVGGRWLRLNYRHLDPPMLDRNYTGLMVRTNTVSDWSDANYAATWGRRYGLQLRDEVSKTGNPYRALELSDHFGAKATIDNPEVPDAEPKSAVVTRAYWLSDPSRPRFVPPPNGRSDSYLMLHLESAAFGDSWQTLKSFLLRAPRRFELQSPGKPSISARVTGGSCTNSNEDVFDIYLRVAQHDVAAMADGVEYQLAPPADADGVHWLIKFPISLKKPAATH